MDCSENIVRKKITLMSFACSLLVVWIHTYNLNTYGITDLSVGFDKVVYFVENYWNRLTGIAVPLFFFISGFLFFRTYTPKRTLQKYRSRLQSIVIPYVLWCTIYYLFFAILSNVSFLQKFTSASNEVGFSLIHWLRWLGPDKYYTLWFLQNLIVYIILCPILYFVLKNRKLPLGTILMCFLLANVYFRWIPFMGGFVEYALGGWLAMNYKDVVMYKNKYLTMIGWIYLAAQFITGFRWFDLVGQALFVIAAWFAMDSLELVNNEKEFPWWMKMTFFTYVAHDIFLEAFQKMVFLYGNQNALWALGSYMILPVIVYVLLVGIAKIMQTICPTIWKVLVGKR